ncbi:hypothetical protein D3C71_1536170 [compost metagenome]
MQCFFCTALEGRCSWLTKLIQNKALRRTPNVQHTVNNTWGMNALGLSEYWQPWGLNKPKMIRGLIRGSFFVCRSEYAASEFGRAHPKMLLEYPAKMGGIIEAPLESNLRNGAMGLVQIAKVPAALLKAAIPD